MIYNIIVVFLLVFSFPILGPINSAYVAFIMALTKLVYNNQISRLISVYENGYIKIILWSTIYMTAMCALWTYTLGACDFSLTNTFFSLFASILMTIIIVSSLNIPIDCSDFFESIIVNIFVIQAVFSIAAFVSPHIREVAHNFQFKDEAEKSEEAYAGFRGLAISGRLYFEFASTCGLATLVQFKRIVNNGTSSYIEICKLLLIIICGFFAGRSSMIGIFFGFIYLILYKGSIRNKIRFVLHFLLVLLITILTVVLILPSDILLFITDTFIPWVFDLLIKLQESGDTHDSASFNNLNDMYRYINITAEEWIYGSGFYMNAYGGYYKYVDGGYIRHILYWGVIGSFFSIIYSIMYFIRPYIKCHSNNDKLYILLLCSFTLLLHYKGDLAPTSRFYHIPLIFIMLQFVYNPFKSITRTLKHKQNNIISKWKQLT